MEPQAQLIEAIRADIGADGSTGFDRALLDRFAQLVEAYSGPDFECAMIGAQTAAGAIRTRARGRDGMREVVSDWLEAFDELRAEKVELERVGDSVVMNVVQIATSHGVEIPNASSIVFLFDGDRITTIEFHLDQDRARESALSGPAGE